MGLFIEKRYDYQKVIDFIIFTNDFHLCKI